MLTMQSLAQEVSGQGILVNGIAPGAIRTPTNREAWATAEVLADLLELFPYGRIGEPDDVIGTTLLADDGMLLYPGFCGNG